MDKWPCLFLQLMFKAQNKCKSKIRKGRGHLDVFAYLTTQKRQQKIKQILSCVQINLF